MSTNASSIRRLAAAGLASAALATCQSYEMNPIEPRAVAMTNTRIVVTGKQLPPSIMLVVDRSGSMLQAVTGTGMACSTDGTLNSPYDPRSPNPCKWNDLRKAVADPFDGFLTAAQGLAQFGLLAFPGETGSCSTGRILVPVSPDSWAIRDQILNKLTPHGGTPTAASLLEAAADPLLANPEKNRRRFVMLLTDGLPNCNAANAALCQQCRMDASQCDTPTGCRPTEIPGTCQPRPFDGAPCLDEGGLVGAVEALRAKDIETFVIGFGAATATADANQVLSRAAEAGGNPRRNAPTSYYQANSVEELRTYLIQILQDFPCTFSLDPKPPDGRLVSVSLVDLKTGGDIPLVRGPEWDFTSNDLESIRVIDARCRQIQDAPADKYEVRITYAQPL